METTREHIRWTVERTIRDIVPDLPPSAIDPGAQLRDLGADSVDRVEIILSVLDRLGVAEPMASFSGLPSIDALIDVLWESGRS